MVHDYRKNIKIAVRKSSVKTFLKFMRKLFYPENLNLEIIIYLDWSIYRIYLEYRGEEQNTLIRELGW